MGYSTDFIGHVRIEPPLNAAENEYLSAYNRTRRWDRPQGRFVVLDHPLAPDAEPLDDGAINRPAPDEPGLWCPWTPCLDGHCLSFDGVEKPYAARQWLAYLIDVFLLPGAEAARSGDPQFAEFTFNHTCNGVVAWCRRENGELGLIIVENNEVDDVVITPGETPEWWGPLPYQPAYDSGLLGRQRRVAAWRKRIDALAGSAGGATRA